jgi:hypothetical protein
MAPREALVIVTVFVDPARTGDYIEGETCGR